MTTTAERPTRNVVGEPPDLHLPPASGGGDRDDEPRPLGPRTAVRFHIGTADVGARIIKGDGALTPGAGAVPRHPLQQVFGESRIVQRLQRRHRLVQQRPHACGQRHRRTGDRMDPPARQAVDGGLPVGFADVGVAQVGAGDPAPGFC